MALRASPKVLSVIANGFFVGYCSVNLYTGGQEVVVAEVVGDQS
jgi:hypothetical protein